MINKSEIKPLEQFNFSNGKSHYFEALNCTFWDSDNIIQKKYKSLKNENQKDSNINENIIAESHKTLLNYKSKSEYLRYLMIEYTLSQPNNLSKLYEIYYSIIFPYYLFLLRNEANEDLYYLILDYINFSFNFYERNNLKNSFEIDAVSNIILSVNGIEIQIVNNKEKIQIIPFVNHDLELIYTLIIYMAKIKKINDNNRKELKKVNEINQNLKNTNITTINEKNIENLYILNNVDISKLKILSSDNFVPKGIIFSIYISLECNKNSLDRYLLLGRRYIYLFKSEYLKELLYIIPITAGFTIIEFEEIYQKIRFKSGIKEFIFYIYQKEPYNKFMNELIDILNGNKEDIFGKDDIFKCSKSIYEDKIMGGIFENTPIYEKNQKDLKKLEDKLNELKNIKNEIEKDCYITEIINQKIKEDHQ